MPRVLRGHKTGEIWLIFEIELGLNVLLRDYPRLAPKSAQTPHQSQSTQRFTHQFEALKMTAPCVALPCENSFMTNLRRFLIINPNTNAQTTERLTQTLQAHTSSGMELIFRTAQFGANYIACEASHAVAAHACVDAWMHHMAGSHEPLDGVLIACFGDPGLFALREVSACPVTGLAEASFIQASAHGPFAIVTGGERWKAMLMRLAQNLGYANRLLHIETVAPSGAQLQADPAMAADCLSQACIKAAASGARSIILGGAGLAGYAHRLQSATPVPLIDSALAGLQILTQQLAPAAQHSHNGSFAQWHNMPQEFSALASR